MSDISHAVNLLITADSVVAGRQGFKRPGILSYKTTVFGSAMSLLYTQAADVATAFGATSPEYLAAAAIFGQSPRPKDVAFLKGALPPTQRYTLAITAKNSHVYQLRILSETSVEQIVSYTSDSSATTAEIAAGMVTAINAVSGKNFTATGSDTPIVITANAAGGWFSVEILDRSDFTGRQNHADPGVATDLSAILLADSSWYWLYTMFNSDVYVEAVAVWAEAAKRMYFADSSDTRDLLTSTGTQGCGDVLHAAGYTYTASDFCPRPATFSMGRLLGNLAPRNPGSYTAKFKQRVGMAPLALTETERANLVARAMNFYEYLGTIRSSSEGTTAVGPSSVRGFIDNVVALDSFSDDASASILTVLASQDKIDRTDEGMLQLASPLMGALDRAVENRIAKAKSTYVSIPAIADMDDLLPRGVRLAFGFTLRGAIHDVDVTGQVVL